jgi:hypothetical protein
MALEDKKDRAPKWFLDMGAQYGVFPALNKYEQTTGTYRTWFRDGGQDDFSMSGFTAPNGQVQGVDGKWALSLDGVDDKLERPLGTTFLAGQPVSLIFYFKELTNSISNPFIYGIRPSSTIILYINLFPNGTVRIVRFSNNGSSQSATLLGSAPIDYSKPFLLGITIVDGFVIARNNQSKDTIANSVTGEIISGPEAILGYPVAVTFTGGQSAFFFRTNTAITDNEWATLLAKGEDLSMVSVPWGPNGEYAELKDKAKNSSKFSTGFNRIGF